MSTWLDTETKALLQKLPPEKYAPPDTGAFTLVLLRKGDDITRVIQSLARVPGVANERAVTLASGPFPLTIASELSCAEALLGQFEFVCSDSVSVFLRDDVVSSVAEDGLAQLCSPFLLSREFEEVPVSVTMIPQTNAGRRFTDQFLGGMAHVSSCAHRGYFCEAKAMRKKARIMAHWAKKIGAHVTIAEDH